MDERIKNMKYGIWFSHLKDRNPVICKNLNEPGGYFAKWINPNA
jgi:hypothetical protein